MIRALVVILVVPGAWFLVPGSSSGFEVHGSGFSAPGSVFSNSERRTACDEPRTANPEPGTELRTRTGNQEPGTRNDKDLPDGTTFLREAREALSRSQEVWHHYSYKERRTDVHINPFGRMGTGDTRLLEVTPSPTPELTYRRVIERNGVPLPKHELDRQDAEYREKLARVDRQATDGHDDDERADMLARRRAQMVIADVLNTLRFEVVRREVRDGRTAIVVAFAARPDAKPATRQARIARVFKGNAWVDEASREVMHVEAVAIDDVSFGGFIAKLYEGTHAVMRRREIDAGVWMPTSIRLTGDVRALFRKARIEYVVEWFDYRRLRIASESPGPVSDATPPAADAPR